MTPARFAAVLSAVPSPWSPASLSPAVWLTAGPTWCFTDAGATTPCADGDLIYTWVNRGSAGNFVQATSGARPTLVLANGRWVVRSASGKRMDLAYGVSAGAAWYQAMCMVWTSQGVTSTRLFAGVGDALNLDMRPALDMGPIMYRGALLNAASAFPSQVTPSVISGQFPASGTGVLRQNLVATATGAVGTNAATSLELFGHNGSGDVFVGDCYGVVSTLGIPSATDMDLIERFLGSLAGLSL